MLIMNTLGATFRYCTGLALACPRVLTAVRRATNAGSIRSGRMLGVLRRFACIMEDAACVGNPRGFYAHG